MSQGSGQAKGLTILVADDEVVLTRLVARLLREAGYTVEIVHDGQAAVAQAKRLKPDLILMDIAMPELNGYEATRQIKAIEELSEIPVVFVTGTTSEEDQGRYLACGGVAILRKPFRSQQILDIVSSNLRPAGSGEE